jgi:hypothetical protein
VKSRLNRARIELAKIVRARVGAPSESKGSVFAAARGTAPLAGGAA